MTGALVIWMVACATPGAVAGDPAPATERPALRLEVERPPWLAARSVDTALATRLVLAAEPARGGDEAPEAPAPSGRTDALHRWERALKWSTAGALVVTSTLGTLAAIDQPTAFGDGRCATGNPVLGTYGCDRGLSTLHGISGVLSATLYTANGVLALSIPGPIGNVSESERPWHRALTYVHLGGIAVQPLLGLVAAYPQVIGVRNTAPGDPFPRDLRTVHLFVGYITMIAYVTTLLLEQ